MIRRIIVYDLGKAHEIRRESNNPRMMDKFTRHGLVSILVSYPNPL